MRMRMVDPEGMCDKHLKTEHWELHMILQTLRYSHPVARTGWIARGFVEANSIFSRHEEVVEEMQKRGLEHNTPLDDVHLQLPEGEGHVDRIKNMVVLRRECCLCDARLAELLEEPADPSLIKKSTTFFPFHAGKNVGHGEHNQRGAGDGRPHPASQRGSLVINKEEIQMVKVATKPAPVEGAEKTSGEMLADVAAGVDAANATPAPAKAKKVAFAPPAGMIFIRDLAEQKKLPLMKLWAMVKSGKIPGCIKAGGKWWIPVEVADKIRVTTEAPAEAAAPEAAGEVEVGEVPTAPEA